MLNNQSVSSTAARSARLRRYGPVIIVYTAMTAVTGAWFMGDTNDYVSEIYHYTTELKGNFWEFGHLLWQPLGYAVFRLFGSLVRPLVGDDPQTGMRFCLVALNWFAGLASVLFMHGMAARVSARDWAAHLATVAFILTQAFLNFTQTGCSYIPGLALLLACFYFLSKPEAAEGTSALSWLWAGLALAGSLSLWTTYLWAIPAALLSPFFWFGVDRQRLRLVSRTALVFGLATSVIFLTGAFNAGVRDLAGLRQWIAAASHGITGVNGLPRMALGLARSLINLGNDGLLFKRFLLRDSYNPVSLFDLIGVSLWKMGLFYLFLALLLINLRRTPGGRRIFHLWILSAAPALAFALFWQGGDMERYLALYPLTFIALAYLPGRERTGGAFLWVAAAFIAVMSYANLATMAIPALESRQQKVIARIADLNAEAKPKTLLVTPHFQDELVNFNISFPSHSINRQAKWRLIDLVSPGMTEATRWRERFAVAALSAWQDEGEVWLARRALAPRPNPEWIWAEGDDRNVSWADFPKLFSQLELGRSVGDEDGFILLPRSPHNERLLHFLIEGENRLRQR
ncbi:MAG TPA: hypothetical protein VJ810_37450 [Blastocatellia bacterium]|nr:hypothetical protein [Blastocatellia bacterium]